MKAILEFYRKPSANELAQRELEDAMRHLLEAQRNSAYFDKLSQFYEGRIYKLRTLLKTEELI
jgi:hypothetical protein